MSDPSHRALYALILFVSCGPTGVKGSGGAGGSGGSGTGGAGGSGGGPPPGGPFGDFPNDPVIDGNAPSDSASRFGVPGSDSGGPCLIDPELGALIPQNWLRLRIHFEPPAGQDLFEIRIHVDNQIHDYVVYTDATTWTMPKDVWSSLVIHSVDLPITISVRGIAGSSPPALGSRGTVTVAPAMAGGAIVYWTTSNGTALKGFHIGDESVQDVLRPPQAQTQCIGCHTSTPDGKYAAFTAASLDADDNTMFVGLRSVDGAATEPAYLSAAGKGSLARTLQEAPAFSPAHFVAGDRIALSMFGGTDIIWTDLESGATGTLARTGDPGNPASVNFSHDGTRVAYCSTPNPVVSGVQTSGCDLYTIPYGNRSGGSAAPVAGASDPAFGEFYPSFSPDDTFLAFNRLPADGDTYGNPESELYLIPAAGGSATHLVANDPPACSGRTSPGLTNSWPKWSPTVTAAGARKYYWLTFSSTRRDGSHPQLYVTAVVTSELSVETYPALYLWNQPESEGNHTPAWDSFLIPVP
jgi:hypothetical protein